MFSSLTYLDTWALSLASVTWRGLSFPSVPASNLYNRSAVNKAIYDPVRDRMLVFGGLDTNMTPLSDTWSLSLGQPVAVSTGTGPGVLKLGPARPNPTRGTTSLDYEIGRVARVELGIFSVAGECVKRLLTGQEPAGIHRVTWDGEDEGGHAVPSGIYFVRLSSRERVQTRRIAILR
jgi:hypothetical protein